MKTISHHRVPGKYSSEIVHPPAAGCRCFCSSVFPPPPPLKTNHRERSASAAAEGDASPRTTPEKINRFASALTFGARGRGTCKYADLGGDRGRGRRTEDRSVCRTRGCTLSQSCARAAFRDDVPSSEIVEPEVKLPCGVFPLTTPHLSVSFLSVCAPSKKGHRSCLAPPAVQLHPETSRCFAFRQAATGLRVPEEHTSASTRLEGVERKKKKRFVAPKKGA